MTHRNYSCQLPSPSENVLLYCGSRLKELTCDIGNTSRRQINLYVFESVKSLFVIK